MKKVRYVGGADQKILSDADMKVLGFDDHPGLWWTPAQPVHELEDDIADAVLTQRDFVEDPTDEELTEELIESRSKEDLAAEAKTLGLTGISKLSKEDLAEAIVAKKQELADQAAEDAAASASEGAGVEPHA